MARFRCLQALAIALVLVLSPRSAASQQWQEMTNPEVNQITNTTQWRAMEQTLQRAGYVRAVNHEEGFKQFVDASPAYQRKHVRSGYRNATLGRAAAPGYVSGLDENGQPYQFYAYTVTQVINGAVDTETFTWDTPANIGDDSKIISILKNYVGCVSQGLSASGFAALASGLYDGDSFVPTLLGGAGYTYYSCISAAWNAWFQ